MTKIITKTYEIGPGADLKGAYLRRSNCVGADFLNSNLKGTNLEGMIIDDGEGNEYVLK